MAACRIDLLRAGYSPLPADGKKPVLAAWPSKHDTNQGEIELWDKRYPDATNTGVLTKFTPAIDIDVTLLPAAEAIEKLAREGFEERGVILVRIGNPPKRAILLRTDEPFEKLSREFVAPDGSKHKIEVLCDGQQVIVDGIHPDTQQPYTWEGGAPWELPRADLPDVSKDEVLAFLDEASEILVRDHGFQIARTNKATTTEPGDIRERANLSDLVGKILAGRDLHDSITRLAASYVAGGMRDTAARAISKRLWTRAKRREMKGGRRGSMKYRAPLRAPGRSSVKPSRRRSRPFCMWLTGQKPLLRPTMS